MSERNEAANLLLAQVLKLPRTYQQEVPADYIDSNGHVNMMYYTMMANLGMRHFLEQLGLRMTEFQAQQRGFFALRQVISYLNELREGQQFAVHSGIVNYDAKRLHFMHYVVNLSNERVASTDERIAMYIDLSTRRSTTFGPEIEARLETVRLSHAALGWQPELSGSIQLKART